MNSIVNFFKKMNRKVVYFVVFLSILLPLLPGFDFLKFSVTPQKEAVAVFDIIESMKEGDAVFFDWNFDPSLQAELLPFVTASIKHCFKKKVKVLIYFSSLTGTGLGKATLKKITDMPEFLDKKEGVDYLTLDYQPISQDMLIFQMMTDFKATFKNESKILDGIQTLKDISYIIPITGSGVFQYYSDLQLRFGYRMGVSVTAVLGPDVVPYLQTGQITGMVNGMRGAADYEKLVNDKYFGSNPKYKTIYLGTATKGLTSLTLSHLVIFGFILIGNIIYFYERKQKRSGR